MTDLPAWLAAEGTPPGWDTFAQYSVLGIAVFAFGWVLFKILSQLLTRSGEELAREVARGDRLEAENRAMHADVQEKAIPALLAAANALSDVTELLREQQRDREYEHRRGTGEGR